MNHATLTEVLQPRHAGAPIRCVKPAVVPPGSIQENIISTAAVKIRGIYARNVRAVRYDAARPESFFDACLETRLVADEAEQHADDDTVASIARAIFERANWFADLLRPTTAEAQALMREEAIKAARTARTFFARQQALDM